MGNSRCFQLRPEDNVATMLDDASAGVIQVLGQCAGVTVELSEPVRLGHKVALCDIAVGQPVMKFGVPIGRASRDISVGQWVHLHNCQSNFDERSATLDLHSGAATDTRYE